MPTVKTFPELNMAALRLRQERALALWYILRSLDESGSGYVPVQQLRDFVADHGFGSLKTLQRTLRRGQNQFWNLDSFSANIYYVGILRLASSFDLTHKSHPVLLDVSELRGVATLRAAFFDTFCAEKPRMMSRLTMAKLTGRSAQTTRNYCKRLEQDGKLRITTNSMRSERKPSDLDAHLASEGYYISQVDGQTVLLKRMANTYFAEATTTGYGQLRHFHPSFTTRGVSGRRYFQNKTALLKALHCNDTGNVLFLATAKTDICGTQLWTGTTTIGELGKVVTC